MNALLVPVEEEVFELYSGCLGGIDGEVVYDYWKNGKDTEFPHDEFHCVLQMEADLYSFAHRSTPDAKSLKIISIEVKKKEFQLLDINGQVIYKTRHFKGLDVEALKKAIYEYLDMNFIISYQSDTIRLNNGQNVSFEEFKRIIRDEQGVFFEMEEIFTESDKQKLYDILSKSLNNTNTLADLKKVYRLLMLEYHPDTTEHEQKKALYCSQVLNRLYSDLSKKYRS